MITRRDALKRVVLFAAATASVGELEALATGVTSVAHAESSKKKAPWKRILSSSERRTVKSIADLIIPADALGVAASSTDVPAFIDEWVSAPYPKQKADLEVVRKGLAWIDVASKKRFRKRFDQCIDAQKRELFDDIVKKDSESNKAAYPFFQLMRRLVVGGYYSTQDGWKAIGYVGNIALGEFPGPSEALLKKFGFIK